MRAEGVDDSVFMDLWFESWGGERIESMRILNECRQDQKRLDVTPLMDRNLRMAGLVKTRFTHKKKAAPQTGRPSS